MPIFEHDGIQFHYEDSGEGLPFVFQHGLGADSMHPAGLYQPSEGIRLITLENRGHGMTVPLGDPHKFSFDVFADDVLALMDHLGIISFVAGGISMGAGIALNLSIRYPARIRALVLVRPAWLEQPNPDNLRHFAVVSRFLRHQGGAERGLKAFRKSDEYTRLQNESPQLVLMMEDAFLQPAAAERVIRYEKMPADAPNRDPKAWERIAVPTLVLGCKEDEVHPYAYACRLAKAIPRAELVEVPAKANDPEGYAADGRKAISDFLNGIIQARGEFLPAA